MAGAAGIRIFLLESMDPWFNLAAEEWLFSRMETDIPCLLLWRNTSALVIGRFQNPWVECDVELIEAAGVNLARRQSGGGTVYHDSGNTNFTFLSGIKNYSRENNSAIIIKALACYGISALASGRNDILVEGRKISGSAFKQKRDRALHHGTLLIDADISNLSAYLSPPERDITAKGVGSVRARVANLSEFNNSLSHELLCASITGEFKKFYDCECEIEVLDEAKLRSYPDLIRNYQRLKSWEWIFGKTPEFSHRLSDAPLPGNPELVLTVRSGIISGISFDPPGELSPEIMELFEGLKGIKYERSDILQYLETGNAGITGNYHKAILFWFKQFF